MENNLPVSNPPTVDDALRDFERYNDQNTYDLAVVGKFLNRLTTMAEPETILASDTEGRIIEGALQRGFDTIDDNADLLVVHANDLIKYVNHQREFTVNVATSMANRQINKVANIIKDLVERLEEAGIEDPKKRNAINRDDAGQYLMALYPKMKEALK